MFGAVVLFFTHYGMSVATKERKEKDFPPFLNR